MDLHDLGQSAAVGATQHAALIRREPRIVQIEIVLQVMVSANEQEETTAGG